MDDEQQETPASVALEAQKRAQSAREVLLAANLSSDLLRAVDQLQSASELYSVATFIAATAGGAGGEAHADTLH